MLMWLMGFLGVGEKIANYIVNLIDWGTAAFVILNILMTIITTGAYLTLSASIDYVIYKVKALVAGNLKAQAVIW